MSKPSPALVARAIPYAELVHSETGEILTYGGNPRSLAVVALRAVVDRLIREGSPIIVETPAPHVVALRAAKGESHG